MRMIALCCILVVFPEPLAPMIATNSPLSTYIEIASHGDCTPRPFQKKASDPRSDPRATVGKVVLP